MQLSRKTVRLLGALYQEAFWHERNAYRGSSSFRVGSVFQGAELHDLLFDADVDEKVCAELRLCRGKRELQDWT